MPRTFVEMARESVNETVELVLSFIKNGEGVYPHTLNGVLNRLLDSEIMLLRAVEEVEQRPWWRRRRRNPYMRRVN